jgi:hypothetical protein
MRRRRGPSLAPLLGRLLAADLGIALRSLIRRLRLQWHRKGTRR